MEKNGAYTTLDNQNFTTTLLVDQTPREVFNFVNTVRGWWSEEIEGSTDKLNDEFIYQYKDVQYCKIKLIEVIPDKKVVWLVTYNYFNFVKDQSEWTGTKVRFEISQQGNKTQLLFTHEGLVPEFECYGVCSPAWTHYVRDSLLSLITTGKGHPNQKESDTKTVMEIKHEGMVQNHVTHLNKPANPRDSVGRFRLPLRANAKPLDP